jgi:hypothetical protein
VRELGQRRSSEQKKNDEAREKAGKMLNNIIFGY